MTTLFVQNQSAGWTPRTDVLETEQGFQLQLDLPGIRQEELDIQVANGTLTIRGERKLGANPDEYHWVERPYGSFSRVFRVPEHVDQPGIRAKLADGVLSLTLPRREESKPKQIQVQVQ